jgi:drug/metabolite transporter (DMT)-like permease
VGRRGFHLLLFTVVLQWGLAFVAIKILLRHVSPLGLTMVRFAITAAAFGILMAVWRPARARIERDDLGRLTLMALAGVGGYHVALNYGQQFVSAGVAALIIAAMPVMVVVLSARLLGETITPARKAGIATALGGVAVLTILATSGATLEVSSLRGTVVVLSPICWAIYTVLAKPLVAKYGGLPVTAITMIAGSLLILPFALATGLRDLPRLDAGDWGWVAFLALGCTVYAYAVWNLALSRLEASSTAAWVYLVPLFSLSWGWVLLGEGLTAWVILGGALVLGGVILSERVAPRLAERAEARVAA